MQVEVMEKPPKVVWFRGDRDLEGLKDPRMTFEYNRETGVASLSIKKCKNMDEAKYKIKLLDEAGKVMDYAGFSVFVKGSLKFQFEIGMFCTKFHRLSL